MSLYWDKLDAHRKVFGTRRVAEFVVPFVAGAYILMTLIVIGLNIREVPGVFALIFHSAFDLEPAFGGIFGMAVLWEETWRVFQ